MLLTIPDKIHHKLKKIPFLMQKILSNIICQHFTTTYRFPAKEMHTGQLSVVWLGNVDVQTLTLVHVSAAVSRHFDNVLLWYFPYGSIQLLQVSGNWRNILLLLRVCVNGSNGSKLSFIVSISHVRSVTRSFLKITNTLNNIKGKNSTALKLKHAFK